MYLNNQKADFFREWKIKSLGLQNGLGKYFSHSVQYIPKVFANSLFSLEHLSIDPNGRLDIGKIMLDDEDLFLASVYGPCDSQQQTLFTQNLCTDILSLKQTRPEL